MTVISIDLAYKDYADIGAAVLQRRGERIIVEPYRWGRLGLRGRPTVERLSAALAELAEERGAEWLHIDGPQGWKAPDNGLEHARICERQLATQGKTGLPGTTKPANYVGFITFSIELFDALGRFGWSRMASATIPEAPGRCLVESFPTAAWRSLGLKPLPGKASASSADVHDRLRALLALTPLDVSEELTHDELQAVVSGLAGIGLEGRKLEGVSIAGVAPFVLEGTWREGFIVNPTQQSAA